MSPSWLEGLGEIGVSLGLMMKRLATILAMTAMTSMPAVCDEDTPKKIVFIAGAKSHSSGDHEFRAGCMLLAKALNEQSGLPVKAEVVGTKWGKDKSVMDGVDAVVVYCDATKAIKNDLEFLDGLAKKGVGLMFMHYAVHPSAKVGEKYYRPWIGGAMENNWSVNPHWLAELKVMPDHEISEGVPETFESFDEFYYNMRFLEDRTKVLDLVTAIPERERMRKYINMWDWHGAEGMGKPQTLMWGREREDGGRGVGFTGGHYHRNWALDGFRTVVLNAIVWTAGMKVPEGGVKSDKVTEDALNENLDDYGDKTNRIKLPDLEEIRKMPPAKIDPKREKRP
ncbi:ThuA domain-containing protein [Haloferula sp.]|uniref:ThuA domain-containing protein n=1 Tax=Haloferula sp. TaxID=2497595 RepID=UPI00329EE31F